MAEKVVSNPVQAQFDEFPYPNVPIEQTVTDNFALFANSLTTARYLRDRKVVLPEGKVILNAGCGSGWETLVVATPTPALAMWVWIFRRSPSRWQSSALSSIRLKTPAFMLWTLPT